MGVVYVPGALQEKLEPMHFSTLSSSLALSDPLQGGGALTIFKFKVSLSKEERLLPPFTIGKAFLRHYRVSGKCGLERTRIRTRTRTRRHQYYDTEMVVTMAVCSVLKPRGALMETS